MEQTSLAVTIATLRNHSMQAVLYTDLWMKMKRMRMKKMKMARQAVTRSMMRPELALPVLATRPIIHLEVPLHQELLRRLHDIVIHIQGVFGNKSESLPITSFRAPSRTRTSNLAKRLQVAILQCPCTALRPLQVLRRPISIPQPTIRQCGHRHPPYRLRFQSAIRLSQCTCLQRLDMLYHWPCSLQWEHPRTRSTTTLHRSLRIPYSHHTTSHRLRGQICPGPRLWDTNFWLKS